MSMKRLERSSVKITDLVASTYNPRKISPEAMSGLAQSIERFGLVQEVVVNRRNMRIIGGHQRVEVLKKAGEKQVPVVWVDLEEPDEKEIGRAHV